MNIYENNKQLLTVLGGDAKNYSTDFEVRKAILDLLGGDSSKCYSIYDVDLQILKIYQEGGGAGGGKTKVLTFDIDNTCIVDGTWGAESIDTSLIKNMADLFYNCSSLTQLDVSGWNTSNVINMYRLFYNCTSLTQLDVSGWNTSMVRDMDYLFYNCNSLTQLDLSGWNASNISYNQIYSMFGEYNSNISNLVGGKTLDEVIANNIGILNGVKANLTVNGGTDGKSSFLPDVIDSASIRALMNGIADLTGQTSKTIRLSNTVKSKLTDEDIAIATAKNWTIA